MGPRRDMDPRPRRRHDRRRPGPRGPPPAPPPLAVGGWPLRVELAEELGAAFGFVGLADGLGHTPQAVEGAQEAAVGLVPPADVARPPPPGLAQAVEAAMVADAEVGVGLDVVPAELAQLRPGLERPRPPCGDGRRRVTVAR